MKYGKHSSWNRFVASKTALIIVIVLFCFMAKAAWTVYQKSHASEQNLNKAIAAYADLQSRQTDILKKVAYLSTDEGVEAEIRSKFRAAKDDESVAVIIGEQGSSGATTAPTVQTASVANISWWRRVLQMVGL